MILATARSHPGAVPTPLSWASSTSRPTASPTAAISSTPPPPSRTASSWCGRGRPARRRRRIHRPARSRYPSTRNSARVLPVVRASSPRRPSALHRHDEGGGGRPGVARGAPRRQRRDALDGDAAMADVVRRTGRAGADARRGTPATMQANPTMTTSSARFVEFLEARLQRSADLGIAGERVVLDPASASARRRPQPLVLAICAGWPLGRPVLWASRARFLGKLLGREVRRTAGGSLACACWAGGRLGADPAVHDVAATRDAVQLWLALRREAIGEKPLTERMLQPV